MMKTHLTLLMTFLMGLSGMSINQTHLMLVLLCIESMTLSLFMSVSMLTLSNPHNTPMSIIILTLSACEASIGLTLLVISSNANTNDLTKNLTLLKC
uniref:NADH-ubiquinone oxidoreductase chain 4L n=1 Tax=Calotes mystaceus TaxID=118097 RepID=A0A7M1LBY1_9SAUR|nr:NADH dehydrogenase subunit 4L [Calotes mystaceus]QOQ85768.1 NADH dehydrogenase subunit 4L [Calotes mystaceus]